MAGDWVKLHRQTLDSQVFSDPAMWHLFCWCLLKTNWKTGWFQGVEVPPGSFATGREAAGQSLGMSGSAWYRNIKKLEAMGVIAVKANNRFTVISVLKWSFFQNGEQPPNNERTTDEQPPNNERTTDEQRVDTIEEGNNSRKEEGKNTHTHSHRKNQKLDIPPELAIPFSRWAEWVFTTTGKPIPTIQAETLLMDLGRRGPDKASRDIEFSILKGAKTILDSDNDFNKRFATERKGKPRVELQ